MQAVGIILTILGFLTSLSGIGALVGIPMIIVGVVCMTAPEFSFVIILSALLANSFAPKGADNFWTFFCVVSVILALFQGLLTKYILKSEVKNPSEPISNKSLENVINTLNDTKECPYCKELVKIKAIKCKHCGSEISDSLTSEINGEHIVSQKMYLGDDTLIKSKNQIGKLLVKLLTMNKSEYAIEILEIFKYNIIKYDGKYELIKGEEKFILTNDDELIEFTLNKCKKDERLLS